MINALPGLSESQQKVAQALFLVVGVTSLAIAIIGLTAIHSSSFQAIVQFGFASHWTLFGVGLTCLGLDLLWIYKSVKIPHVVEDIDIFAKTRLDENIHTLIFSYLKEKDLDTCLQVSHQWNAFTKKAYALHYRSKNLSSEVVLARFHMIKKNSHILKLIDKPCPIWKGKKIYETHMLVPKCVNSQTFLYKMAPKLSEKASYKPWFAEKKTIAESVEPSDWLLITKKKMPVRGFWNKLWDNLTQQPNDEKYHRIDFFNFVNSKGYRLPTLLEGFFLMQAIPISRCQKLSTYCSESNNVEDWHLLLAEGKKIVRFDPNAIPPKASNIESGGQPIESSGFQVFGVHGVCEIPHA